jgi:tRNA nucleotidyltransferase (CCA-adding enzyme)
MKENHKINLPEDVRKIIHTIEAAGFEAYAVGGCVRDSLLGRTPDDWDITTSAKPEQVKNLFRKTIDTGIAHGTVTVMMHRTGYEVTTYRIDGEYEDSRHPKEVTFTASLIEDLRRRDFTINAMAYNDRSGIVDEFDGMEDLQQHRICAVGNPLERFGEDALRIMRAVRFSAQLGYEIEEHTKDAIKELADNLNHISAERIQVELIKLVKSPHPEKLRDLYELGITAVIMPEFDAIMETKQHNPHHKYSVGEHTIYSMMAVEENKVLRLAMLFHDFGKPLCKTVDEEGIDHFHGHAVQSEKLCKAILKRLKFDNETINMVSRLVRNHDYDIKTEKKYVRRAVNRIGEDVFPLLLKVKQADLDAQSDYLKEEKQQRLCRIIELYQEIVEDKECVSLDTLAVKGGDLIVWGMRPGREIGEMLSKLLDEVLENPENNQKEKLYSFYQKFSEEMKIKK